MALNISPELLKKLQAHRVVLTVLKNNGTKQISYNEVLEYLFSNSPIAKEVDKYMSMNEANLKAITESREKIHIRGNTK